MVDEVLARADTGSSSWARLTAWVVPEDRLRERRGARDVRVDAGIVRSGLLHFPSTSTEYRVPSTE